MKDLPTFYLFIHYPVMPWSRVNQITILVIVNSKKEEKTKLSNFNQSFLCQNRGRLKLVSNFNEKYFCDIQRQQIKSNSFTTFSISWLQAPLLIFHAQTHNKTYCRNKENEKSELSLREILWFYKWQL